MAPNAERTHVSFPYLKYPEYRDEDPRLSQQWLKSKRLLDGADGLWRVHNKLYDLTHFIATHPGGTQWLEFTKGTDITEAFETNHLHGVAETILPKYYVRDCNEPRNSPFTFNEEGFYKTLKTKVREVLKQIPQDVGKKSDLVTDMLFVVALITNPLCCYAWTQNWIAGAALTLINGLVLTHLTVSAHNYFHRSDNWRMYLFNFSGMNYAEWRISHVLSHHLYTNTLMDLEVSMLEPLLIYTPYKDKSLVRQLGSLYNPLVFPLCTLILTVKEAIFSTIGHDGKPLLLSNLIPLMVPVHMYVFGGLALHWTLAVWFASLGVFSFFFLLFGMTAGHHSDRSFFDGDVPREEHMDFGIHQLDTMVERVEYAGNHFKSLTRFGDHTLHHLFPTLDHAQLKYLYPTLLEHCEKFETELKTNTFYEAFISQSKQLKRKIPNNFRDCKKNIVK